MRRFYDSAGRTWLVYDVSSDALVFGNRSVLPPAFRDGWIVFECDAERRRLAPIPPEWVGFPESALRSLLDRAEPVSRRATPSRAREGANEAPQRS